MKPDIYFSTDIETDGPIPGQNSILSMGTAAFDETGKLIGTFSANFEQLLDARPDPQTMEWWATQPAAWMACRTDVMIPKRAMSDFIDFVERFKPIGRPVFVAYPAGFDFLFVYWYLMRFCGHSPFSFSATKAVKRNWPAAWRSKRPHTHIALDDAIGQGEEFFNIRNHLHTLHENHN